MGQARTLAALVATGGLGWAGAVGWVLRGTRRVAVTRDDGPWPALVLGCRPGPGLDGRVDAAIDLWRAGRASVLVISGVGEATVGAARARAQGVPSSAIVVESSARSTWENLVLSRPWLGVGPFFVVSDPWHLPRAMGMARRLELTALPWPARVPRSALSAARQVMREGLSVLHAGLDGRLR